MAVKAADFVDIGEMVQVKPKLANLIIFDGQNRSDVRHFIRSLTGKSTVGGPKVVKVLDGEFYHTVDTANNHVVVDPDGTLKILTKEVFDQHYDR